MSLLATHLYRELNAEQPPEDPDEDRLYEQARDAGPVGGSWSPPSPAAVRSSAEEE